MKTGEFTAEKSSLAKTIFIKNEFGVIVGMVSYSPNPEGEAVAQLVMELFNKRSEVRLATGETLPWPAEQ